MLYRFVTVVLVAGVCWWLSFDLGLHWWLPIWLAPVPVLWLAPKLSGWGAFGAAFLAFLIGRCAWLSYLLSVLPVVPVVIFTVLPAVLFGLVVLPARAYLKRDNPVKAALSFTALWTAVEFLLAILGRDGTIVSIAYTQSSFLPVIQVAALTGVTGIAFVLCLVPGLVAAALVVRRDWGWPVGVIVVVMGFGLVRMQTGDYGVPVKVGMVVLPEQVYGGGVNEKDATKEMDILRLYAGRIEELAGQGCAVVVLPEKVLPLTDTTGKEVYDSLARMAARLRVELVAGVTGLYARGWENLAPVFGRDGAMLVNYQKVHLFEGEVMEGFNSGRSPGVFGSEGVAICKDFDFESYMREYGKRGVSVMYDPAWDFVRDGWWHSRVAIVGAVANGYSLVRNAREGRLTISDNRGRVSSEASSESREMTSLTGIVRPSVGRTLYARWGDWFGWLMLAAALISIVYLAARRSFTRV